MEDSENIEVKPLTWKEKRIQKLRKKFLNPVDMKYVGPLSYRYLRILGWIALALGQLAIVYGFSNNTFGWSPVGETGTTILSLFGELSTPFFIIASFGVILSGKRDYKSFLIIYGVAFLAIGLGIVIAYFRYIDRVFSLAGVSAADSPQVMAFLSRKSQVNVFSDLLAFSLFHFFLNYDPKKIFVEKKLYIWRLFALIPIIYIVVSYILKTLSNLDDISLPFFIYPFLTTKSPMVLLVFVLMSLWIKNRGNVFKKIGASEEQYQNYLKTNRNSFHFSVKLSLIILAVALFELLILALLIVIYASYQIEPAVIVDRISFYGLGQGVVMILAIPFILLYSYTKVHEDTKLDIIIPIAGFALIAFVYFESIFSLITHFLGA